MLMRISVLASVFLVGGCGAIQPVTHAQTDGALCSLYGAATGQHRDRVFAEIQSRGLMPDEYWDDVNASRLTVGMPTCAVRAVLASNSAPMIRDYGLASSITGNRMGTEGALLASGASSSAGIGRGGDEWGVRSYRFTSGRSRMESLRNSSAVWAQFEKRSRTYPLRTYNRPAYSYGSGDY